LVGIEIIQPDLGTIVTDMRHAVDSAPASIGGPPRMIDGVTGACHGLGSSPLSVDASLLSKFCGTVAPMLSEY
jgi:hypothetical protein